MPSWRRRGIRCGNTHRVVTVRKGEPWGSPSSRDAEITVAGDDRALAEAVSRARDVAGDDPDARSPRIAWHPTPDADFARAVSGAGGDGTTRHDLPCDAMLVGGTSGRYAVNMAVLGVPPDRTRWSTRSARVRVRVDGRQVHDGPATGMVVANGEFLRGADLIPRGHPGDGCFEVQVYAVPRRQRAALRARIRTGTHVPHPGVVQARGKAVLV